MNQNEINISKVCVDKKDDNDKRGRYKVSFTYFLPYFCDECVNQRRNEEKVLADAKNLCFPTRAFVIEVVRIYFSRALKVLAIGNIIC